jgi:KDO2-lipid IV(A) lauroyltransferase
MIHDQTGGCIFITPHLGCYTLLPYLFSAIGIPLTVPIQEMGNDLLQRRWCPLNAPGSLGGQIFVAKRNSMNLLRTALRSGQSVGMMADQRTMRGLAVEFLGATAPATPIPAMLAVGLKRPIIVGVCSRDDGGSSYNLVLCEPIWPDRSRNAKLEIARLTQELNLKMGEMIRDYPEQYLWMHNRWKTYRVRRNRAISLSSPAES